MVGAKWGPGIWGTDTWQGRQWPPGAVWHDDWRWWTQHGATYDRDITANVIEARWGTDSHTLGDGTFRGDLQPGRLNVKLYDATQDLAHIDKLATIWATFNPTGDTWCWFVDQVTQQLAVPNDPLRNQLVLTADTWPDRLTASSYNAGRPAEAVDARVNAIVTRLNTDSGLALPAVAGAVEADPHIVPAVVSTPSEGTTVFAGFLQQLRDAASNGLLWLEAVPGAGAGDAGSLLVHYQLVETVWAHSLYNDQVVAGSVWTQGHDSLVTEMEWSGVNSAGAASDYLAYSGGWGQYGLHKVGPLRIWGDISAGGAARAATDAMANETFAQRGDPNLTYVDSLQMVSGDRQHSAWAADQMVWPPHGVMQWYRVDNRPQESYRVQKTDHILTARQWWATHTLEPFVQPTHIG